MATTSALPLQVPTNFAPSALSSQPADKYRGAVVEVRSYMLYGSLTKGRQLTLQQDLQLPPAFSLPREEAIAAAIELAYDRDFSHIPYADPCRFDLFQA